MLRFRIRMTDQLTNSERTTATTWKSRGANILRRTRMTRRRLALFLAVVGPGLITSNVDNDAGGITVYTTAGAHFGYTLLWSLIPMTIALYVSEEMCARMGVVTGKGLSDLIREEFGFRSTFFVMVAALAVDLGNTVAEFAGVAASMQIFGVSKFISVPLAGIAVWLLVVKGSYRQVEKIFLVACGFYLSYVVSAILAKPDWLVAAKETVAPTLHYSTDYLLMLTALVGTTIAPWQFFYLQAGFVEKRVGPKQYKHARLDVLVGSISCMVIVFFIIVCCAATLNKNGMIDVNDAAQAAAALVPLAGRFAAYLFAFGLLNASLFAASILPLSTAHVICEGLGLRSWHRPQIKRSARVLRPLHRPDHRRRRHHPAAQRPAVQNSGPLAGRQRRLAPRRPDFHPAPDQPPRPDGRTHQHLGLQPRRLGYEHHHDHPHPGPRLRRDHPTLQRRPRRHPNPFSVMSHSVIRQDLLRDGSGAACCAPACHAVNHADFLILTPLLNL